MKTFAGVVVLAVVAVSWSKVPAQEKLATPPRPAPAPAAEPSPAPAAEPAPAPGPIGPLQVWGPRPESSGCCCSLAHGCRFWDWLTYHPLSRPGLCGCCRKCPPCCPPHLYLFFLADCQEAAARAACAPTVIIPEPVTNPDRLPPSMPSAGAEANGTSQR